MASELPRIISKKDLKLMIPFSPQHILRLEKQGRFPRRIQIGLRRVGWRLSDIEAWIAYRASGNAANAQQPSKPLW